MKKPVIRVSEFRRWLERNKTRRFSPRIDCRCPIARYLQATTGLRKITVDPHLFWMPRTKSKNGSGRRAHSLPAWASRFIKRFDQHQGQRVSAPDALEDLIAVAYRRA